MLFRPFDRCWSTPLAAEIERIETLQKDAGASDRGAMARIKAADAAYEQLETFLAYIRTVVSSGAIDGLLPIIYDGNTYSAYRIFQTDAYAAVFLPLDDDTVVALLFTTRPDFAAAEAVWAASLFMQEYSK